MRSVHQVLWRHKGGVINSVKEGDTEGKSLWTGGMEERRAVQTKAPGKKAPHQIQGAWKVSQ